MKFFLLLVLVLLVVWLLRGSRRLDAPRAKPADPPASPVPREDIVACAHCGLLLPAGEALPGSSGGVFCSDDHRVAFKAPPP